MNQFENTANNRLTWLSKLSCEVIRYETYKVSSQEWPRIVSVGCIWCAWKPCLGLKPSSIDPLCHLPEAEVCFGKDKLSSGKCLLWLFSLQSLDTEVQYVLCPCLYAEHWTVYSFAKLCSCKMAKDFRSPYHLAGHYLVESMLGRIDKFCYRLINGQKVYLYFSPDHKFLYIDTLISCKVRQELFMHQMYCLVSHLLNVHLSISVLIVKKKKQKWYACLRILLASSLFWWLFLHLSVIQESKSKSTPLSNSPLSDRRYNWFTTFPQSMMAAFHYGVKPKCLGKSFRISLFLLGRLPSNSNNLASIWKYSVP